ncbi:DUF916 domain-containing protein [Dactylosporangium sp. AC04546]|uniref:DUF916 domain-containing protein n=1 Tax=Dactylosporangium sp. AC04546 TaxID=2862460 RepID=UPI001EE0464B|nr:DUF916 domain-containing protein [Dactylosporangium sp. AC04546]WVK88552.1 DUF916 domain-containing protein [Dactylosporangium sp. AC04546]
MRRLLALVAVLVLVPAAPAHAAPEDTVTWTVQPATPGGPDGRRWIERTLDPGQAVTEHLAVRNFGDTTAVFALKAADGYLTDKGRFNMLPSDRASVDGGTWVAVQPTVRVGAKETVVVPFTITAPAGATPGDHPAGIAATVTSAGGQVNVESRVGFRLMLRASGTPAATLSVTGLTTSYERSWNPFRPGRAHVTYTVTNTGNVWLSGQGRVSAGGGSATADVGELLPKGTHQADVRVGGVWPFGRVRTTVTLTPVVLGDTGAGPVAANTVTTTATAWALPWSQLLLLAALVGLVFALRNQRRTRRRRLDAMLDHARAEGRESALRG